MNLEKVEAPQVPDNPNEGMEVPTFASSGMFKFPDGLRPGSPDMIGSQELTARAICLGADYLQEFPNMDLRFTKDFDGRILPKNSETNKMTTLIMNSVGGQGLEDHEAVNANTYAYAVVRIHSDGWDNYLAKTTEDRKYD